jgi:8-oxo-dGTP diphosphatase
MMFMDKKHNKPINVVAGVIRYGGKILCVQRGLSKYEYVSKKWEFPGGKVENDESDVEALVREILEELGMKIEVQQHLITVNHTYPDFQLIMKVFFCDTSDKEVKLTEHLSFQWLSIHELNLDWAEADKPIVALLKESIS